MYCFLRASRRLGRLALLAGLLAGADFSVALVAGGPGVLIQSVAAQAPTGSAERPVAPVPAAAPVPAVRPAPPPANMKQGPGTRGLWVLAGGIVVAIGFILFRIFTARPQAMPVAAEDESARVRRHQHRRGQGRTPASREEQRISESSRDEFMNAPMRQTAPGAAKPRPDAASGVTP